MRAVPRRVKIGVLAALLAAIAPWLGGCASRPTQAGSYTADAASRNPALARELHARASELMATDTEEAERLLRQALDVDLYHGPAHNNLGVLLLTRGELYAAAAEFEWARKLMPGHPDPRVNLAMTLEQAGRYDEAINAYDSALAVYDGFLPALQGKTKLQVRMGDTDAATLTALDEIALRGDESWKEWARMWRVKLNDRHD